MSAAIFGNVSTIMLRLYQGTEDYLEMQKNVKEFVKFHRIHKELSDRLHQSSQETWWRTSGIDMSHVGDADLVLLVKKSKHCIPTIVLKVERVFRNVFSC